MKTLLCLLLWALCLSITSVHADEPACVDLDVRIHKNTDAMVISNVAPCGVLLKFKASARMRLYRVRPKDSDGYATPYPPKTTCRWWSYWGGVSVIAVDKHDCNVFLRSVKVAPYRARVKRMRWPKQNNM